MARRRIGGLPRLSRGVFGVSLEPQRIGAKIDFVRPFEASSAITNMDLREERGIGEGGKNSNADQVTEAANGRLAVRPGQSNRVGARVGSSGDDDVIEYLWHL